MSLMAVACEEGNLIWWHQNHVNLLVWQGWEADLVCGMWLFWTIKCTTPSDFSLFETFWNLRIALFWVILQWVVVIYYLQQVVVMTKESAVLVCFVAEAWNHILKSHTYTSDILHAIGTVFNPLNPELNPICYLLALLGAHYFLHVSRIRVKLLTFRRLMSYIYGAPILDVSRSHTTTLHSR